MLKPHLFCKISITEETTGYNYTMFNFILLLLVSVFLIHFSSTSPFEDDKSTGLLLVRIRCPEIQEDCHMVGYCYSAFNICASYGSIQRCSSVPNVEMTTGICMENKQDVISIQKFPINNARKITLTLAITERSILSDPKRFTVRIKSPMLKSLFNATDPTADSWTKLVSQEKDLKFELSAVIQCRPNRFGSFCEKSYSIGRKTTLLKTTGNTSPPTTVPWDPCSFVACHNGVCQRDVTTIPKCVCRSGWKGRVCAQRDVCFEFDCKNEGICMETSGKAVCKCRTGWQGPKCEFLDLCLSLPCKNGGNCTSNIYGYKCDCLSPYYGSNCELIQQTNFMNQPVIIVVLIVAIAIILIMGCGFAIRNCHQSSMKSNKEQQHRNLNDVMDMRRQRTTSSGVYDKVDFENYYTDNVSENYADPDELIDEPQAPTPPMRPRLSHQGGNFV